MGGWAGRLGVLALLGAALPSELRGQRVTGSVEGWVADTGGAALEGVAIVALGRSGRSLGSTTSDPRGHFRLTALPVDTISIVLRRVGYRPMRLQRVRVRLGATVGLGNLRLTPGTVSLSPVLVVVEAPLLDPASTAGGGHLPSELFEALPVDRTTRALPTLLPQADASFYGDDVNIAGGSGPENVHFVDGVNLTDPYRATGGGELPYHFVREIQVSTGGYEAEYGRALGGVVNVITRSGDNVFRGEAFGYLSSSALAATWRRGLADAEVEASTEYDAGLAASGPIARDRLWFFTAYSRAATTQDIRVPGFPLQADRRRADLFAAKLDWAPRSDTWLALTLLGDPSRRRQVAPAFTAYGSPSGLDNLDPFLGDVREGGYALSLRARHQVAPRLLLEGAISRLQRDESREGDTERARAEPLVQDLETGRWSGGFGDDSDQHAVRAAVKLGAAWSPPAHLVKAGVEYEDNRLDADVHFTDPGIVIRLSDAAYQSVYLITRGTVRNRVVSAFLQDSWLMTSFLRLNAGLRWDGQYLIGADGRLAQRIADGLQPRVGLILHPARARWKAFAWVGRHYEQLPLFASAILWHSRLRNGVYFFDGDPRTGRPPLDSLDSGSHDILPPVAGLRGQHIDEFVLGGEQLVGTGLRLGVRGVHRRLREVIDDGLAPGTLERILGNPGRGRLSFLPRLHRSYYALELTLRWRDGRGLDLSASYVLSRNRGNYTGLFDHDVSFSTPNAKTDPDLAEQAVNADGPLPNDRTHVFKAYGVRRFRFGLTVGATFVWQSGTPLNELGATFLPAHFVNLRPRGTAGRTPSLRDLGLRFTYDIPAGRGLQPSVSLDLLHVASARVPLTLDQLHYSALDAEGRQSAPNPSYRAATRYQPPMLVRLGGVMRF